jgi:hypothetical protein
MGTDTDVAIEASDLTLVRGDLRAAADAIRLARRTPRGDTSIQRGDSSSDTPTRRRSLSRKPALICRAPRGTYLPLDWLRATGSGGEQRSDDGICLSREKDPQRHPLTVFAAVRLAQYQIAGSGDRIEATYGRQSGGTFRSEVMGRLHRQPGTSSSDAGLLQPDGQVRAHPRVAVQDPAQRHPGDAQPGCRLTDAQSEVSKDVLAQDLAGVHRVLHHHVLLLAQW